MIVFRRFQDHFFQLLSKKSKEIRNLQGEKFIFINEENEPKNVASGFYDGLKGWYLFNIGGAVEIWKGVEGVVTKPYKKSKQEGVMGFFKV